ncbi:MAG: hypothetical protein DIU52_009310 [bacterium]|jgi:hypothetical protein
MRARDATLPVMLLALLLCASAERLGAQQSGEQEPQARATRADGGVANAQGAPGEIDLVFEREVFSYPLTHRRDPFSPLNVSDGPRFEELTLRGIIYSPEPGRSVALLAGPDNRIYRVRRGETVGNARVLDVGPRRVLFAVNNFGVVRQEVLELKRKEQEGA